MRKNIFTILIIMMLCVISQVVAMGQKQPAKKPIPVKTTPQTFTTTGNVTGINIKDSTISLSTKAGGLLTIIADKNTVIYKAGKIIKLIDIKKGDSVSIGYKTDRGKNIATSVIVEEKRAPSPKKRY